MGTSSGKARAFFAFPMAGVSTETAYAEDRAFAMDVLKRIEMADVFADIRMSSARRVFDVINGALHNTLDVSKELEMSW